MRAETCSPQCRFLAGFNLTATNDQFTPPSAHVRGQGGFRIGLTQPVSHARVRHRRRRCFKRICGVMTKTVEYTYQAASGSGSCEPAPEAEIMASVQMALPDGTRRIQLEFTRSEYQEAGAG